MLKNLKKEDFIKGLKELVEHLEVNKEVDLENFNNEVLKFAYSNKKPFEEVVKECVLKEMKTYIDDCELNDRGNIYSVVSDYFMPDNKYGYFPSLDENLAFLEQIHYEDSDLADEIVAEVKEQIRYSDESSQSKLNSMVEYNYTEAGYYMEFGMKKIVNDEIENASNDIRFLTGINNYKIDKNNISRGDLKAIRNSIVEREDYSKEEIKKDILLNKKNEKTINDDIDELKNEIYKTKRNIIMEEFAVDLAKDVITLEKNGGNRNSYSKENENIYKQSIKKTVNKLVDDNLSLEEIKKINKSNLEMYDNNYFNSFLIFENDLPISFVETNYSKGITTSNINEQLFAKIKEAKGEEYLDNMNLEDIRDWNDLKRDLPNLEILYYENEFDKDKNNAIEYTDYEKYERDSIKTFLTFKLKDEEKYILHKSIGNLSEERIELFIEDKKEYIENDLKIDLEYLNEELDEKTKELKKIKQTNKEEKNLENVKAEKEIEIDL